MLKKFSELLGARPQKNKKAVRRDRSLRIESLEARALLAATSFDVIGGFGDNTQLDAVAAPAVKLNITGPDSAVEAGVASSFTVTALDDLGNVATGYRGTIHFESVDSQAELPNDYTFTAEDLGSHTFTATLKTAVDVLYVTMRCSCGTCICALRTNGYPSIIAADLSTSTIAGSAAVTVEASALSDLRVTTLPTPVEAGGFANFSVTAVDAYGNTVTGYRGTVHFSATNQSESSGDFNADGIVDVGDYVLWKKGVSTAEGQIDYTDWRSRFVTRSSNVSLPADYTFTDGDKGARIFNPAFSTPGAWSLTATDSEINSIADSNTMVVVAHASGARLSAAAAAASSVHFAAIGDFGDDNDAEADVAALVKSWNPELIITMGDNNYETGSASTIDANIGKYYHEYIYQYTGNYGAGSPTMRFYPSLGNHDWGNDYPKPNGANPYKNYFTLPGNERYYTFTQGPVQFFAIDSDENEPDGTLATSTQALWLQSQLAASTATYKIVYFHHPPYTSQSESETEDMRWPFQEWGATAVLTGHSHTYERLIEDNNFPYFVNGLGGRSLYDFDHVEPGSQIRYSDDYGAMLIDADSSQLRFQFISLTGAVIDTYTIPSPIPRTTTTLVPAGTNWKFLDNGSNQGTAWRATAFNDAAWASGPAQLGYGEGDEQTVVGFGPSSTNRYITTYFRKSFVVSDPSAAADGLELKLLRDDGAVVYLNGTEVFRSNMPTSTIGYQTLASTAVGGTDESTFYVAAINPSLLVAGTNVLAVELHQSAANSNDLSFNLSLTGTKLLGAGTLSNLSLTSFPSSTQAGAAGSFTVTALDVFGNTVTGYRGTIHFTSSDPQAVLPADYTFTAADNGTHTFSATLKTVGTQSLVATDTATGTIAGNQSVTVQAAAASKLLVAGFPAPIQIGVAKNFTVTALDAYGNTATGYRGRIHFSSSDPLATLPADYTFTAADNGTHTFSATFRTAGTQTLVATDTVTGSITGTQTIATPQVTTFIAAGSAWKYLDNGTNQGTAWRATAFNDATWASGAAELGYGDGDEQTVVGFGSASNRYITTYFRKSFVVSDPSVAADGLTLNLLRDDGAVVYLNGTEVFRTNMPTGTIGYQTVANVSMNDDDESTFLSATINPALLVAGTNVLAVEIHQWDSSSTDISFNSSLTGTRTTTSGVVSSLRLASFPSPAQAGVAGNFTVTAVDGVGATVAGYRGTIHFTSSDPQAVLPADYTFTAADNGTHTFSATLKTSGTQSLVATDTATGTIVGSQSVTVQPAVASSLRLAGFPSPVSASVAGNFTVTAQDAYGNTATGYRGAIHFTSSDSQAVLPADYTFTAADNGAHTFSATLKSLGSQSIVATDTVTSAIAGSQSVTVQAAVASSLRLASFPSPAQAGVAGNFTVTAVDGVGATVAGYRGTIHFTSSDPQVVLPADYTFTAADNGTHTFGATLKTSGTQSLVATDTATGTIVGSQSVTVQAAVASSLRLAGFPSPVQANVAGNFTVTAQDAYGNTATGYRGTIHLTSSDPQAVLPADYTFTAADNGAHTFSAILKSLGSQSIVATDTATSTVNGSQSVTVQAAVASSLRLASFPSPVQAGSAGNFTVTAVDGVGATVAGYRGTIHFTSSDPQAVLPADYTFTAADNGTHTFSATLKTSGTQSLVATDTVTGTIVGSQSVTVQAAVASSLRLAGFPSPVQANVAGNFTVTAQDAYGNTATGYRGTIHLTSSDPQAVLPVDYTFTAADNGAHTFSATLKSSGSQSIAATDTATSTVTGSQTVTVQSVPVSTTLIAAGSAWKYLDNGTNQGTAWRATAFNDATWASGAAQLGYGDGDEQTVVGFGSASNRYITTYFRKSIVVADPSIAANSLTLNLLRDDGAVVYLNGTEVYRTNMPTGTIGYQTVANVSMNDADESTFLSATINPALLVAGTNVISVEIHQWDASSTDISFDLSLTGVGTSTPGVVSSLRLINFPSPTQAGAAGSFIVTAVDGTGATVTGYQGTIHFTSSDPQAILPADYTFTPADNGTHTFSATLKTSGTRSLVATDTATGAIAGSQSVTVQPAIASSLRLAGFPSPTSTGVAANFTVTAQDAYGNTATGYQGTIHFTSSDSQAVVPADYTFTAADNGTHTFSATLKTSGSQSITATDTTTGTIAGSQTVTVQSAPANTTLVAAGSAWKYLDNGTNQGTAWRATAFDDTTWASGAAQLGYGDGDEQTVVGFGSASNRYITTYFRKSIVVADPSVAADGLTLNLLRDDGAVVYLNGTEVYRNNMPTGTIGYQAVANVSMNDADESTFLTATINPALLVAGTNVIAVEIHQWDASSTDISFNLSLVGTRNSGSGLSSGGSLAVSSTSSLLATETAVSSNAGTQTITAPASGASHTTRFAVIGDFGASDTREADVAARVKSWNPDLILTAGDNNFPTGSASTIDLNVGQYYHNFIFPYLGSYGAGAATNRFFPVLGNRDWGNTYPNPNGAQPYLNYFALPGNERYYTFTAGPVQFFALDSDRNEPDGILATSTQGNWLQTQLAASTATYKIVYFHHPPYSSTSWSETAEMRWPFQVWGATAVLTAHAHNYERVIDDNHFAYFVNGLGGNDSFDSYDDIEAGSEVRYNADNGALFVTADESQIQFQFITRTGAVIDTYTIPAPPSQVLTTFVPTGAVWKYLDNGTNQGTAWRSTAFNDSTWSSGPAQLGYGDDDEQSVVGYGSDSSNKYITTYFRKSFVVSNPSVAADGLAVHLLRDDGAVIYLNGTEVFRSNMPTGTIGYQTLASGQVNGSDESAWYSTSFNSSLLVAGTNVLAVEIHQRSAANVDVSFDLSLVGTRFQSVLPGDYNNNDIVDAADYVVWRKGLGPTYTQDDYGIWRPQFGATAGGAAENLAKDIFTSAVAVQLVRVATTQVAAGSISNYLENGTDQGTASRTTSFADSTTDSALAQFGDSDEKTVVGFRSSRSWYRTNDVRNPSSVSDRSLAAEIAMLRVREHDAFDYALHNDEIHALSCVQVVTEAISSKSDLADLPALSRMWKEYEQTHTVESNSRLLKSIDGRVPDCSAEVDENFEPAKNL